MKCKILIATFPYGHVLDDRLSNWISFSLIPSIMNDKDRVGEHRIEQYACWSEANTPITMLRNACLKGAEERGYDWVLMLDSDNIPDWHIRDKGAKPFWDSTFDFMWKHRFEGYADPYLKGQRAVGPSVCFAPYCGPPPFENPYTFDWANHATGNAFQDFSLEMPSRFDAAQRTGFRRAAAGPTGVMLIDMLAIKRLKAWKKQNPHLKQCLFYYEWKDYTESEKASTEDVAFTRDLNYAGVPVYCNYDSWAGHVKQKVVGKPENLPIEWVPKYLNASYDLGANYGMVQNRPHAPMDVREKNTYDKLPDGFPLELVRKVPKVEEGPDEDPVRFEDEDDEFEKVSVNGDQ